MTTGGIILCGGRSQRMGRPKPMLPFGPELMLQRVVRVLSQAVDVVVVVAGPRQELPQLPDSVIAARDRHPDRGPLEGLAAGLRSLQAQAEVAFVSGCDVPFLLPQFVHRVIQLSSGYEVAVPHINGFDQSLSAVYRTSVLPVVESLLAADRLRPAFLFDQVPTRRITAAELSEVDPQLQSVANVNSLDDYRAALTKAGFEPPTEPED